MTISFSVVDEQRDFVVLDKAPGISFHSDDGPGLVAKATATLGYALFPVHRLDKVTSGLIILARSSSAAAAGPSAITPSIQQQLDAVGQEILVHAQRHRRPPLLPATRPQARVQLSSQEPDNDLFFAHIPSAILSSSRVLMPGLIAARTAFSASAVADNCVVVAT